MKHFSAQYTITNSGPPLKRAVISTEDNGKIINIEDTRANLRERHSLEYHNGIIIPGFVNCHCHLELSHMKNSIGRSNGLGDFIEKVRNTRNKNNDLVISSAYQANNDMYQKGVVLCADICNTSLSFDIKKTSKIKYINLLEVFGIDPEKAKQRLNEIISVSEKAEEMKLPYSIIPHSVYSTSLSLFNLLKDKTENNNITSIHFMETAGEISFLENYTGPLITSYKKSGLIPSRMDTVKSHVDAVMNVITKNGNLILVHNTYVKKETIRSIKKREKLFWCLCPNSNIYIEDKLPPLNLLLEEDCEIVIGTDSLASNNKLDILEELKTLQLNFPSLSIEELVQWATINGAKALGKEEVYGKIEPGKTPGLMLLQNVDLQNMKLLPNSFITRLI